MRTNLITNPSFEVNTTGWVPSATESLATSTEQAMFGTQSLKVTTTTNFVDEGFLSGPVPVTSGLKYAPSMYLWVPPKGTTFWQGFLTVHWYDAAGTKLSGNVTYDRTTFGKNQATPTGAWTRIGESINGLPTAPPGAATARLNIILQLGGAGTAYLDGVLFEQSTTPRDTYFDGDSYLSTWSGTPHASTSVYDDSPAGSAPFSMLNVLRLEVEKTPADGVLTNLIKNPSGDGGAWGWVTPVAGSTMTGTPDRLLEYWTGGAGAQFFYSENYAVTPGHYIAARWDHLSGGNLYYRQRIEFLNSSKTLIGSTPQTGYISTTGDDGPFSVLAQVIPANTAYARLRFDLYSNTSGGVPAAGIGTSFYEVTMATATTSAALGATRTNLVPNPSFEVNTTGWTATSVLSITRSTAQAHVGTASLLVDASGGGSAIASTGLLPITGGETYAAQAQVRAVSSTWFCRVILSWYNSSSTLLSQSSPANVGTSNAVWTQLTNVATAPSAATQVKVEVFIGPQDHYVDAVMLEQVSSAGAYFDGSTAAAAPWTYSWTGTAHASTSTAISSNLQYVEPIQWQNILGPSPEIGIRREDLNVGTLTVDVRDTALDPAVTTLIRPGKQVRVTCAWYDVTTSQLTDTFKPIFQGNVLTAQVEYDLLDKTTKQAHITLTAADAIRQLDNQAREEGVATIDFIRYLMEGAGVPWKVNSNSNQMGSATITSKNENASLLDQISLTRDTALGYAWVDRYGILKACDAGFQMTQNTAATAWGPKLYGPDFLMSYNSEEVVNEVMVKWLRYNSSTGETEEIMYGPYRNAASINEWGAHQSEYTIQGVTESASAIEAYANSVLAKNAVPVVQVRSVTIPIRRLSDLNESVAMVDLYDRVTLTYPDGVTQMQERVLAIEHSITPELWTMTVEFGSDSTAARPQVTPSPRAGG